MSRSKWPRINAPARPCYSEAEVFFLKVSMANKNQLGHAVLHISRLLPAYLRTLRAFIECLKTGKEVIPVLGLEEIVSSIATSIYVKYSGLDVCGPEVSHKFLRTSVVCIPDDLTILLFPREEPLLDHLTALVIKSVRATPAS